MPIYVPIEKTKDPDAFMMFVINAPEPVTVTKDGKELFVAMRPDVYSSDQTLTPKEKLMERIKRAEDDIANGRVCDAMECIERSRRRYAAHC